MYHFQVILGRFEKLFLGVVSHLKTSKFKILLSISLTKRYKMYHNLAYDMTTINGILNGINVCSKRCMRTR